MCGGQTEAESITLGLWACLWVPKETLWVSLVWPNQGLKTQLSMQISWAASVQRDGKGVFCHGPRVSCGWHVGPSPPVASTSVLQIPPEASLLCLLGSSHPPAPEHSLSSGLWPLGGLTGSYPSLVLGSQ